jgi:hypothetical protein
MPPVTACAALGAAALGLFDWMWRGEWGGGVNPLTWNPQARTGFFESLLGGAVVGAVIGLVVALRRRRPLKQRR